VFIYPASAAKHNKRICISAITVTAELLVG